jgi:hypothetical protein
MILVLPVCHKEIDQALHLADWMGRLGGMEKETCVVVYTWKAKWDIDRVLALLTLVFGKVWSYQLPIEDETGWPVSSNTMFIQTAEYMYNHHPDEPWFWWECDVVPLQPGYWEALKQEYKDAGKPCMGVINESRWMTTKDGVVVEGIPRPAGYKFHKGRHMVGAGIYPGDLWVSFPEVQVLPETPFDMAMGENMVPITHETKLLCHRWSTCDYHRNEKGEIIMEDEDENVNLYGGRPIPSDAMILHGCKDNSLIDLLLASQPKEGRLSSP